MPPPIVCYICGRNYSTASLKIHIPNCIKKWESDQKKLPKAQRRPLPAEPSSFDRVLKGEVGAKDMEKYSQEAFENYNNVALEPCANCGRTFNHSALEIHQRSCKAWFIFFRVRIRNWNYAYINYSNRLSYLQAAKEDLPGRPQRRNHNLRLKEAQLVNSLSDSLNEKRFSQILTQGVNWWISCKICGWRPKNKPSSLTLTKIRTVAELVRKPKQANIPSK